MDEFNIILVLSANRLHKSHKTSSISARIRLLRTLL